MATNIIKDQQCKESKLLKDIITTPYEKVLSILSETKSFIKMTNKTQTKLINDLEWAIKVITSHSLYAYDISDNKKIEKMTKGNLELQKFVQFVTDYNEEIIQGKTRKSILIPQAKLPEIDNESGLHMLSVQLKRRTLIELETTSNNKKKMHSPNYGSHSSTNPLSKSNLPPTTRTMSSVINNPFSVLVTKKSQEFVFKPINNKNEMIKHKKTMEIKGKSKIQTLASPELQLINSNRIYMKGILKTPIIDHKEILAQDFNIFELEKKVGHFNVLPIISKAIFEEFGINNKMINMQKLDTFLVSLSTSYFSTVPYHNSLHGADVALTSALYILYSNIEEIAETNVVDILSLIIACLGHDISHPGLTNNYQINSYSEMALTYNDISCLENFHTAKLFRLCRIKENNIFDTMPSQDFKLLRKRIISMILATDMSNHGKVMSVIKGKIPESFHEQKGNTPFQLIPQGSVNSFEIKQSLFDFLIHSSDLSHNTKPFHISLQWVELLSNEFWNQGDREQAMNLPVSFLCERIGHDIPKSQIGFIKGFILPTFEILIAMFPSLNYLILNAKDNLHQWEKLSEAKRKKGWSPIKKADSELKEHMSL